MEIVAHSLWAAAAVTAVNRSTRMRLRMVPAVWWAVFPDVIAFGPAIAAGLWLRLTGSSSSHVHLGVPLYPAAHSLLVFLPAFGLAALLARRIVYEMLGWLLHILIDIPTHSFSYYATRFLWPVSDFRIDGIAWWTPWFWIATYMALAAVYFLMWRKRWLKPAPAPAGVEARR